MMGAATTAVRCAASVESATAAKAGVTARGVASGLSAVVVPAIGAGFDTHLTGGRSIATSSTVVAFEGFCRGARVVINVSIGGVKAARAAGLIEIVDPVCAAAAVIGVAVIESSALGVVVIVIIDRVMVVPIISPVIPAPAKTAVPADAEANSEGEVWAAKPDAGIGVPTGPGDDGSAIDYPGIVGGHVNHVRLSRLNDDSRALGGDGLLGCVLEIAGAAGLLAHYLYGIRHILFLVVIGVTERGGPRDVFVHIAEDRGKCSEGLDAGIPVLLIHGLAESVALQIRMSLHPAVGFHDLFGEGGSGQDLGDQGVRVEGDRCDQLLQLLGRLLRVLRSLGGLPGSLGVLRRSLGVLRSRQILRHGGEQQRQREERNERLPDWARLRFLGSAVDDVHVLEPPVHVGPVRRLL